MINQIGVTIGGDIKEFQGLSTDTKPVSGGDFGKIGGMSTYYESDTGDVFIYDKLNINPDTGDGWWK